MRLLRLIWIDKDLSSWSRSSKRPPHSTIYRIDLHHSLVADALDYQNSCTIDVLLAVPTNYFRQHRYLYISCLWNICENDLYVHFDTFHMQYNNLDTISYCRPWNIQFTVFLIIIVVVIRWDLNNIICSM